MFQQQFLNANPLQTNSAQNSNPQSRISPHHAERSTPHSHSTNGSRKQFTGNINSSRSSSHGANELRHHSIKNTRKNRRLAFIRTTPIPLVQTIYDSVHADISHLINMGESNAARSFALNAFDDYRLEVFSYIYEIKRKSVQLTNQMKKIPPFVAATAVFNIFDTAQDKIDNYHEDSIRKFRQFDDNLFQTNPNRNFQNEHTVLVQLKRRLKRYEQKVRKVKGIFRQGLAFL